MKCIFKLFIIYSLFILFSCKQKQSHQATKLNFTVDQEKELLDSLSTFYGMGIKLDTTWKFHTTVSDDDSLVHLPHSILLPDKELYYEAILTIRSGYLKIKADDGLRLWVNNERVYAEHGNYFNFKKSLVDAKFKIAVLNNAMNGGLKSIQYFDNNTYNKIKKYEEDIVVLNGGFPKFASKEFKPIKDTISFSIWGDSQGGWDTFNQIVSNINQHAIDFTIGVGDLVDNGIDEMEWIHFNNAVKKLNFPTYLIAGNHEYDGYADNLLSANFMNYYFGNTKENSYYSFNVGNCAFVTLDPNINFPLSIDQDQYNWFKSQLKSEKWKNADWRFLIVHQPPYGQGWAGYHGENFLSTMVDTMAEEYKIDFVLSGHIHDYERVTKNYGNHKTNFIISGGAGGGLEPEASSDYPVMDKIIKHHHFCVLKLTKDKATLNVYNPSNQIIDNRNYTK